MIFLPLVGSSIEIDFLGFKIRQQYSNCECKRIWIQINLLKNWFDFCTFPLHMKYITYIFLFISIPLFAQNNVDTRFINKSELKIDAIIGMDNFQNLIILKNNAISINRKSGIVSYSNAQLGNITTVNAFNPLKINVFYKDFNTVIVLDNRLSEITKINFNDFKPFRNISHISTGNDTTIWSFNQDNQQLELFDYRTNTTKARTLPINENVIQLISNYNDCWLLTETYIYQYNYFGSLMAKLNNHGYQAMIENNNNLYLLKENTLYFKAKNSTEIKTINLPKLLIKQFFVTNETLYIYDDEFLHQYQLIND